MSKTHISSRNRMRGKPRSTFALIDNTIKQYCCLSICLYLPILYRQSLTAFFNLSFCNFRYYAILKPLNVTWESRVRRALIISWVCAGLASLPQSFIFHLEEHPYVKGYVICLESKLN